MYIDPKYTIGANLGGIVLVVWTLKLDDRGLIKRIFPTISKIDFCTTTILSLYYSVCKTARLGLQFDFETHNALCIIWN